MADITEAGATGRKPRGAGAASTAASPEGGAPSEPPIAEAGTAAQVAQAADRPVVLGAGPTPETPGGPGVGAAQVADRVTETVSRPLTGAAEVDMGLRPLSEAERAELEDLRQRAGADPRRTELAMLRGLVGSGGLVIDGADVPGRRLARAATAIKRDGVLYAPDGDLPWVPVDFAAYTELVEIGAITREPWSALERVPDAAAAEAPKV